MNIIILCILAFLVFLSIPASVYFLFILDSNRDTRGSNLPTLGGRGRLEQHTHIWSAVNAPYIYYPRIILRAPPSAVHRISRSFSFRRSTSSDEAESLLREYHLAAHRNTGTAEYPPTAPAISNV